MGQDSKTPLHQLNRTLHKHFIENCREPNYILTSSMCNMDCLHWLGSCVGMQGCPVGSEMQELSNCESVPKP